MTNDHKGEFFHSLGWMEIIRYGLGAEIRRIDEGSSRPFSIPIFQKGPFRIVYPGFPVGAIPMEYCRLLEDPTGLDDRVGPWHMVRIWQSTVLNPCQTRRHTNSMVVETTIPDLHSWDPARLSSAIHRNLKKANRSGLRIEPAEKSDSSRIYALYHATIRRKGGNLRYTESYFQALIDASRKQNDIQVHTARTPDRKIASMLVCAYHRGRAFYLHGATDAGCSSMRPADLLMFNAIDRAKAQGMTAFSFLPSPREQSGLIRFKEKWGGTSMENPAHDIYRLSPGGWALNLVVRLRNISRA